MRVWLLLFLALLAGCGEPAAKEGFPAHVKRVVDGDTLILADGRKVRVLGIDTPELGRDGAPGEPYARIATRRTRDLVQGKSARIITDAEKTDRFKRLLAYVTLPDGHDLGEQLLDEGLAMVYVLPPNLARAPRYLERERLARLAGKGIWSKGRLIPARQTSQEVGRYRLVQGRVDHVTKRGPGLTLHFADPGEKTALFSASISGRDLSHFQGSRINPQTAYTGKTVQVRGRIRRGKDAAITLHHPLQISFVGE